MYGLQPVHMLCKTIGASATEDTVGEFYLSVLVRGHWDSNPDPLLPKQILGFRLNR